MDNNYGEKKGKLLANLKDNISQGKRMDLVNLGRNNNGIIKEYSQIIN